MRSALERWPSGLRRTLGKRVCGKPYRGFESHSLRQPNSPTDSPGDLIALKSCNIANVRWLPQRAQLCLAQSLRDVRNQIGWVLDADRQPDSGIENADFLADVSWNTGVGHAGGQAGK